MRVEGVLLAGGASRRLKRDKRFVRYRGKFLIQRAYESLAAVADGGVVWVSLARPEDLPRIRAVLPGSSLRFVLDEPPGGEGPLVALAAALRKVTATYACVLAVDHPLVTPEFLRRFRAYLAQSLGHRKPPPRVVVPVWQGVSQPTCAFYHRSLVPDLLQAVQGGCRALRAFLAAVPPERVARIEEPVWFPWGGPEALLNINTPQDLRGLQNLERPEGAVPALCVNP